VWIRCPRAPYWPHQCGFLARPSRSPLAILSDKPLPHAITVDLAGVSYIETSGIATLIEALKIARHRQMTFCLQGLAGSVLRLFEVTGVLALFEASECGQKKVS